MEKSQKEFENFVEDSKKELDKQLKDGHITQREFVEATEHLNKLSVRGSKNVQDGSPS